MGKPRPVHVSGQFRLAAAEIAVEETKTPERDERDGEVYERRDGIEQKVVFDHSGARGLARLQRELAVSDDRDQRGILGRIEPKIRKTRNGVRQHRWQDDPAESKQGTHPKSLRGLDLTDGYRLD